MKFVKGGIEFEVNMGEKLIDNLEEDIWKIGFIADNPGILEKDNNTFYETVNKYRCFKNKVPVVLYDKSAVTAHLIFLNRSKGWFCVTFDTFWD